MLSYFSKFSPVSLHDDWTAGLNMSLCTQQSSWLKHHANKLRSGVSDSGERLLIFELNSQTNTFASVLLQRRPPKFMDTLCQGNNTNNWAS